MNPNGSIVGQARIEQANIATADNEPRYAVLVPIVRSYDNGRELVNGVAYRGGLTSTRAGKLAARVNHALARRFARQHEEAMR